MKYSRQREQILSAVKNHPVHPTADMVYSFLREENPTLSLGTVYRNLNGLAAEGKILKIPMPSGGDRFDGSVFPHYHMVCECCGAVLDCPLETMDGFEELVRKKTGFIVRSHEMLIQGECAECARSGRSHMV